MSQSCTIPRKVTSADLPIADSLHRLVSVLDVDGCNCRSIVMPMNEFETATGPSFQHWPVAVQHRMNKEIADFQKEHPGADIRAVTEGVHENCCVLAIHWKAKA